MSKELDFNQVLAQLDRRERKTRKWVSVATILPLLLAIGALGYLLNRTAEAVTRLDKIQRTLTDTKSKLGIAEAQVADAERKKGVLDREIQEVNQKRALLNSDMQKLVAEIESLSEEKKKLVEQTELYESDRTAVREGLQKLATNIDRSVPEKQIANAFPITAVAEPKASAKPIPGLKDKYTFRCWLEVPKQRREQIASVAYIFDHPTFANKRMNSSDASDNFSVHYNGWGALNNVVIEIRLKSGALEKMAFNMYAALGWGQ